MNNSPSISHVLSTDEIFVSKLLSGGDQRRDMAVRMNCYKPRSLHNAFRSWLLVTLFLATIQANGETLYVAKNGSDANDGLTPARVGTSGPVASVNRALELLSQRTNFDSKDSTDRIIIKPGTYELAEPVFITPEKLRRPATPLVVEAETPGTVILSGGEILGRFSESGRHWIQKTSTTSKFESLWINGQRATRARSPNNGRFFQGGQTINAPAPEEHPFGLTKPANKANARSLILSPEAQDELSRVDEKNLSNGILIAMHAWTHSAHHLQRFDSATGKLDVDPPSKWAFFTFEKDQRFYLENLPELLDEPGEWWLSNEGELRYIPRPGQRVQSVTAIAPRNEQILSISGRTGALVENVTIRGIRFQYSYARIAPLIDAQAAIGAPAALTVDFAKNIHIDNCAFEHIGGYGLWFRRGVTDSVISRSIFRDLGAGGIRIGEAIFPNAESNRTHSILAKNNLITDGGKTFYGGVGIWIGQSGENVISHNEVSRLNYSAISVGWTWGFGSTEAYRNTIESNYIHHIGQNQLSDLGGIYILGRTAGSVIRGNRIEDIFSYAQKGSTAWGIYLDQGSSDVLVEKNLVRRTTGGGFHLHYGKNNLVRNNIFLEGKLAEAQRTRKIDSTLDFEQNILGGDSTSIFVREWNDPGAHRKNNLLFRRSSPLRIGQNAYTQMQEDGVNVAEETGDRLTCDEVDCTVRSAPTAKSPRDFANFSVKGAGIYEKGTVLTQP